MSKSDELDTEAERRGINSGRIFCPRTADEDVVVTFPRVVATTPDPPLVDREELAKIIWHGRAHESTDTVSGADVYLVADALIGSGIFTRVAAEAWDEGERHESEYLMVSGQFCPHKTCNPYKTGAQDD